VGVTPDGLACVVDFGEAYSPVPEKPAV